SVNVSNNACQPPAATAAPAANRPVIVTQHQEQQTDGDRGSRRARHASNRQRRISQLYTRLPPPVDTEMRTAGEGEVEMQTADETMLAPHPRDEMMSTSDAEMVEAPAPSPLAVEMADQPEENTVLADFPQDELMIEHEEELEGGELVERGRGEVYTPPADPEWPALEGPAGPAGGEQPTITDGWSRPSLQHQPGGGGGQLVLPAWRENALRFDTDTEGEAYISVPVSSSDEMDDEHYDPRTENIVELAGDNARRKRVRAEVESSEEGGQQVVKYKGPRVNQVGESWRDRETQGALQGELGFVRKCKKLFKTKGINCFPAKSK
ncbi:MAG: hypothetical protein EBZ78_13320, partial [Verrucomicrobia bacterium]|nr:hypothetical protein [Verrucomicrobiota bacterium]